MSSENLPDSLAGHIRARPSQTLPQKRQRAPTEMAATPSLLNNSPKNTPLISGGVFAFGAGCVNTAGTTRRRRHGQIGQARD
jgi:hypothetical protein